MLHPLVTCLVASILLSSVALADRAPASSGRGVPTARAAEPEKEQWVAVHRRTGLWAKANKADRNDHLFRMVDQGTTFRLALPPDGPRVYVWDPSTKNYAWIDAADIGPVGSRRVTLGGEQRDDKRDERDDQRGDKRDDKRDDKPEATHEEPKEDPAPTENRVWAGTARVTMYTCVELGGCNYTASGIWPYEGVVAVDPRLIPLGTSVWIEGLGTFLAADTGSAIKGAAIDVYVTDYRRAISWGIRHLPVVAFVPGEEPAEPRKGRR